MGGVCRFWQNQTLSYFLIEYFNHYVRRDEYGVWSALCILFGGIPGYLLVGYLGDKFEVRNYRTKSHLAVGMSLLAILILLCMFLVQDSFAFNMVCFFFYEFLCDGWQAPILAMI